MSLSSRGSGIAGWRGDTVVLFAQGGAGRCRHYVVAATRFPPPLRLETISVRSGPGPVCENLRLSLPSPAITWTREVGGINCGGDMGVRRCLARFLTSLAFRCALQRVQTVPAAIHSGRIPPSRHPLTGDGRLRQTPPPHRTWSVPDASSQPQLNLHFKI